MVKIWDQEAPEAEPLILQPCRFTTLQAALQSPHQIVLTGKVQYSGYTDSELVRINALMNTTHDIAWEIEQQDMFEEPSVEGESQEDAEEPKE